MAYKIVMPQLGLTMEEGSVTSWLKKPGEWVEKGEALFTVETDKIEMEVEAKNAGLDVYDQMGKPDTPYNYKAESKFRSSDPDAYNKAVRDQYKKYYGIK